jgi:hypothetical protein
MVVDAFMKLVVGALNVFFSALSIGPVPHIKDFVSNMVDYLGHPFGIVSSIIPWAVWSAALGALVAWYVVRQTYVVALWLLGKIHVTGSAE